MFSQNEIAELIQIINRRQIVFIAEQFGKAVLTKEEIETLVNNGVPVASIPTEGVLDTAFKFGILSEAIGDKRAKGMNLEQFKRFLASGEFVPLNAREQFVLNSIKTQSLADIRGLGGKMTQEFARIASDPKLSVRQNYEQIIRDKAALAVEKRKSVKWMVSEIGHTTEEWGRDFDRIADYTLHRAYDEGRAASIEREGGENALVYKHVQQGACKHCIRLYLTAGMGSQPKLFKLSELIKNGTNIKVKVEDWKPIIGATHPYCRCTLMEYQEGYEWDETQGIFVDSGKHERLVQRKSKLKVTVGNKTTEI